MIGTQPRLLQPLGTLLGRMGTPVMTDQVQDPFEALRRIRVAKALLPRLPLLERTLLHGRGLHGPG